MKYTYSKNLKENFGVVFFVVSILMVIGLEISVLTGTSFLLVLLGAFGLALLATIVSVAVIFVRSFLEDLNEHR